MSEDEDQNVENRTLHVNLSDQVGVSDFLTVELSDITITARREDGEEQNITIPRDASSDAIAQAVSDALAIPADASAPFQELIKENVEYVKRGPWEFKMELGLPLEKLRPWLPDLKILSLGLKTGQKTTYKKSTIKKQLPKDD